VKQIVDAARSSKEIRMEKLSGTKLKEAMNNYQAWYQRLDELWDTEDCTKMESSANNILPDDFINVLREEIDCLKTQSLGGNVML